MSMRDAPRTDRPKRADDRALSTVLSYTLSLGVMTLLIAGVFLGVGGVVEDQNEDATRSSLTVVGNRLAADLQSTDHLAAAAGSNGTASVETDLPTTVGGSQYTVRIEHAGGDRYELVLESEGADVRVSVPFRSETEIREGELHGGTLVVTYDASADRLEVSDAAG